MRANLDGRPAIRAALSYYWQPNVAAPLTANPSDRCHQLRTGCLRLEGNSVSGQSAAIESGSQLFAARCSGCHTLSVVGAEGSAAKVSSAEKTNGPNFNARKECYENVVYAIQNGGFSGAIMPANIVVGKETEQIAAFLSKYAGSEAMSSTGSTAKCAPKSANAGG